MTKEEVLALLREQRDRLADEIDGVEIALQAGCSPASLLTLLIPGLGVAVYTTARAACASRSATELRQRVEIAQGVVDKLQEMGEAVNASSPSADNWADVEKGARDLAAAASRVSILSDALSAAAGFVGEVFDALRRIPDVIPKAGWAIAAAAAAAGFLLLAWKK